mgnify:FL=1
MKRHEDERPLVPVNHATTDPEQIKKWWDTWPDADIGIATGDGLLVIDVDAYRGGVESLRDLEKQYDSLPHTPTVINGSGDGALNIYLRVPEGIKFKGKIAPGIDIQSDGGYVVAPPSKHVSGSTYKWVAGASLDDIPIAPAPQWLIDLLKTT